MKLQLLAGMLIASGLHASITTELLTFSGDQESNGMHAAGTGYFAFVNPAPGNPVVIGVSDLTQFVYHIDEQYGGVTAQTYYFGIPDITDFAFTLDADGNETAFTMSAIAANGKDNPMFTTFNVFPNIDDQYGDVGPLAGNIALAVGGVDPELTTSSAVPEPVSAGLLGLALGGLGMMRFRRKGK